MPERDLAHDDRQVLDAFLKLADTDTADVFFHEIVAAARLPLESVSRSLRTLRELGYVSEVRKYGRGHKAPAIEEAPSA